MSAIALGLALGIVTGMPPGLVNVAIAEAASTGRGAFAARLGVGGAIADTIHATIAFVGVGRVVTESFAWRVGAAVATALVLASYARRVWRRRRHGVEQRRPLLSGLLLTLPNPAAFAAWVTVAAILWPTIDVTHALVLAGAVGIGSALWFVSLARWFARAARKAEPAGCSRSASSTPRS